MTQIQSLSIVVPSTSCINNCKFCVAKMHGEKYDNKITGKNMFYDIDMKEYLKRLESFLYQI